jgi:hypothetical protein
MHKLARLAPLGLVMVLALAACGGGSNDNPVAGGSAATTSPTTTAGTSPTTTAGAIPLLTAPTTAAPATATKANANTASQAEIQTALEAAGVPNASRWAVEVVEYRPYSSSDPNLPKLRQNLAKYNPGTDVVDKIVSALSV